MPYYDTIAKQWHTHTGFKGGPFKSLFLNDILLDKIGGIADEDLLELGAGNGYFFPMILKKYSGQVPQSITITDASNSQLQTIQKHFRINGAEYKQLDIYKAFPFEASSIDLIIATMVFNELHDAGVTNGIRESYRVLAKGGRMLMTILHPVYVEKQLEKGAITNNKMKSTKGLLLPVIHRSEAAYQQQFEAAGFMVKSEAIHGKTSLYKEKASLKRGKDVPIALLYTLTK